MARPRRSRAGRGRPRGRGRPPGSTSRRRSSSESSGPEVLPPKRRREEEATTEESRARGERGNRLGEGEGRSNVLSNEAFRDGVTALRENRNKTNDSQLKTIKLDFHLESNREAHHTSEYEAEGLIVRRGQEFDVTLVFDRKFNKERDQIILQLVIGERPQESKGTIVRVHVTNDVSKPAWGMKITKAQGPTVSLRVMSPANAIVGKYALYVETNVKAGDGGQDLHFRTKHTEICVLFNAWCKDDSVYMADESHRQEYVMNDHGRIWMGNRYRCTGQPWNFGQFEDVSLDTALYLMDKSELGATARASPIIVCRVMSQMANYNDKDGGVLWGRWTEDYPKNSTKPWVWTGSVAILEKFARKKYVVRYGQCWVFSGLVTTLCRAVGIPTRSVTNFESAHDSDASMTIDFHVDKDGDPLEDLDDSVWNFHVWNESYFTRPDLPPGYDGWQAHDSTPQETSEGVFRCGPCPVKAVKNGEVFFPYDTGFVFAEVNGDKVYWIVDENGAMEVDYINKRAVGHNISTKAVGSTLREDLTLCYKYPEGSPEERKAVELAHRYSSRREEHIYPKRPTDVIFTADVDHDVMIGGDFNVSLKVNNSSSEKRTVSVAMDTKTAFYTGRSVYNVKKLKDEVELDAHEEKTVTLCIEKSDYIKPKLKVDQPMNTFIRAKVQETNQRFVTMEKFEFSMPELEAAVPEEDPKAGEEFEMTFTFANPLSIKLTDGRFSFETSRMTPHTVERFLKAAIGPGDKASVTVKFKSSRRGTRYLTASFASDQLGVTSEYEVRIK